MALVESKALDDRHPLGGPPREVGRAERHGDPDDGRRRDERPWDGHAGERERAEDEGGECHHAAERQEGRRLERLPARDRVPQRWPSTQVSRD